MHLFLAETVSSLLFKKSLMRRLLPPLGLFAIASAVAALWFFLDQRLPAIAAGFDRDASGALEKHEAGTRLRAAFTQVDRDGSGAVDGAEFRRWLLASWLSGASRSVSVPPAPERVTDEVLRQWLESPVEAGQLGGIGLLVVNAQGVVFEHAAGAFSATEPVALGAASAWPAAAVHACLRERGELSPDAPMGMFAPDLPTTWAERSATELLSHTGGVPQYPLTDAAPDQSLAQVSRDLVRTLRPVQPGERFELSAVGPQIAAWWAEEATGRSWRRLFVECLGWPLSLDTAEWGHAVLGTSAFVDAQAGLSLSLREYGAFLAMLLADGRYAGVRNLRPRSLAWLETERVKGRPIEGSLDEEERMGYALGAWCERLAESGRCSALSAPGALGAYPWLDRERRIAGVVLTVDGRARTREFARATRRLAEQAYGRAVLVETISGARRR